MTEYDYKSKIQKLTMDLDKIIESSLSKVEQSNQIMDRLRMECIFVHKDYLLSAHFEKCATIMPDDSRIKSNLEKNDFVTDWFPVFANSFGPFNPENISDEN